MIVAGILALGYGAAIYFWHDPVTDLYARVKQRQLASQLDETFSAFALTAPTARSAGAPETAAPEGPARAELEAAVRTAATRMLAEAKPGAVLGRITVPALGISPVFVNGTEWGRDLTRGPGRYPETSLPGLGQLTAIAGHRTTFGAWFRHVDELEAGDEIVLELPYGRFVYTVTGHEIVAKDDWSVISPHGFDELVLSACHPLYSAEQRWIVYAKLIKVRTPDGASYREPAAVASG